MTLRRQVINIVDELIDDIDTSIKLLEMLKTTGIGRYGYSSETVN